MIYDNKIQFLCYWVLFETGFNLVIFRYFIQWSPNLIDCSSYNLVFICYFLKCYKVFDELNKIHKITKKNSL